MIDLLVKKDMHTIKKYIDELSYRKNGLGKIDISIVENCNLNCAYCDHFAPLVYKHKEIGVQVFENLLNRLKFIIKDKKFYGISLMGGEPLLHSKLFEILDISKRIFPNINLKIVTNGILLNDRIKNYCFCHNIEILCSKYYVGKKFYKTNLNIDGDNKYKCCNNYTCDVDIIKQNEDKNNYEFYNVFPCAQLNWNGDYFPCIIPANIDKYNVFFYKKYKVVYGKDYVNIFNINNLDKITELNNKDEGINFCKYCHKHSLVDWKISSMEEKEWEI